MISGPGNTAVLCPAYNPPERECQAGLDALVSAGYPEPLIGWDAPNVDVARACLVFEALKDPGVEWVQWVDADMAFTVDDVEQLAQARQPYVAAPYWLPKMKCLAMQPLGQSGKMGFGARGALIEVSSCGLGLTLTHRSVYEALDGPWPREKAWQVPLCRGPRGLFRPYFSSMELAPQHDGELPLAAGDDGSFCARVRESGIRIWCDTRLFPGHVGRMVWGLEDAMRELAGPKRQAAE